MFEVTNSSLIIGADADDPDGDSSGARFQYIPCYYEWPVPEPGTITERGKAAPWCRVWLPECIADRSSPPSRCRVQRLINGGTYLQALFYLTATAPVSSLLAAAAGLDSLGKGKGKKAPGVAGAADPASLATAAPCDKISMTWSVADAMMERMMRCDEPDTDEAMALLPAKPAVPASSVAAAADVAADADAAGSGAAAAAADAADGRASPDESGTDIVASGAALSASASASAAAAALANAHSRSLLDVRTSSAWMQCLKWAGFVTRRLITAPSFPRLKATRVPQTAGEVLSVVACSPELRALCRGPLSQSVDEQPDPVLLHQALELAVAATAAHHFPRIAPGNKARVAKQLEGVSAILKKLMLSSGKSCACGKCVFESFSSYAFGLALVTSLHPPGDLPVLPARVSFDRPACAWSCRAFDDGYAAVRWSGLMGGEVGVEDVRAMLDTAVDRVRRMVRLVDDTRECGSGSGGGSGNGGSGSGSGSSASASGAAAGAGAAALATSSSSSLSSSLPQPNVERGIDFVATLARVVMVTVRDALTVYARVYPRFLSTLVAAEALAEPPAPGSCAAIAVGGAGAASVAMAAAAEAAATAIVPVGKAAAKGDANAKGGKAAHAHAHAHSHAHPHALSSHSHALTHALALAHPTISTMTSADGSITASAIVDLLPALDGAPTTLAELAAQLSAVGAVTCGCGGHHDHLGHHDDHGHAHGHVHSHGHAHSHSHNHGHGHGHVHSHGHKALTAGGEAASGGKKALPAAPAPPTAVPPAAAAALALPAAPPLTPAPAPAPAAPVPAPLVLPDLTSLPPSAIRLLQREIERLSRRKGELAREAAALARAHGEYAALADADAGELARVQGDMEAVRAATATAGAAADAAERRFEGFRGRIAEADLHVKELEAAAKACAASRARLEGTLELRDALRGELEALRLVTATARESAETLAKSAKGAAALAASRRAQAAALKAASARPATHDKDVAALKRAAEAAESSAASAVAREAAALEEAATLKAKIASLKALRATPALQAEIDTARAATASSRDAAAAAAKAKAASDAARAAAKEKAAAEKSALEQRRAAALRASEALRRQMGAAEAELARLKEGMIAAASARDAAIAAAMAILGGGGGGAPALAGPMGSAGDAALAGGLQLPVAMPLPSLSLPFALPSGAAAASASSSSFSLSSDSGSGSSFGLSASAPAFTFPGSDDSEDHHHDAAAADVLAGLAGLPGFSLAGLTAGMGMGLGGAFGGDASSSTGTLQALQTLQALAGGWQT